MGGIFFLTIVIVFVNNSSSTITHEYGNKEACEIARKQHQEALTKGSVVLSTCTRKS